METFPHVVTAQQRGRLLRQMQFQRATQASIATRNLALTHSPMAHLMQTSRRAQGKRMAQPLGCGGSSAALITQGRAAMVGHHGRASGFCMASSMARRFSSSLGGSAACARRRKRCHRRLCRVTACVRTAHRLLTGLPTVCMHGANTAAGCIVLCIIVILADVCMNWSAAAECFGSRQGISTESDERRRHWQCIAEHRFNSIIVRRKGALAVIVWQLAATGFALTLCWRRRGKLGSSTPLCPVRHNPGNLARHEYLSVQRGYALS